MTMHLERAGPLQSRATNLMPALPYLAFFAMILAPGLVDVGDSVSLSVLLIPFLLLGYVRAALRQWTVLQPHARKMLSHLAIWFALFAGWCLVTGFGGESFVRVFRPIYAHLTGIALVLALLALSQSQLDARRIRNISLVMSCVLIGASMFIQVGYNFGDRTAGFFKHPNQLGIVAAMLFVYFFSASLTRRFRALAYNIAALICLAALFMSGSKTNLVAAMLSASLAVVFRAFLLSDSRKAIVSIVTNYLIVLIVILVAATVLFTVNPRAANVLFTIFSGEVEVNQYGTVEARGGLWEDSWQDFLGSPIVGVGAGQLMRDGTPHSHNIFIDSLRTTGLAGFILTLVFHVLVVVYIISTIRRAGAEARTPGRPLDDLANQGVLVGCIAGMVNYLIANEMSDSFGPSTLPFFYLLLAFTLPLMTGGTQSRPPDPEVVQRWSPRTVRRPRSGSEGDVSPDQAGW